MEEFVTYSQAKRLKELGFIEPCICFYNREGSLDEYCADCCADAAIRDYNDEYFSAVADSDCSAPTIFQAQNWIYEQFKYWIETVWDKTTKSFKFNILNKTNNAYKYRGVNIDSIGYETPYEAILEGISKTLEFITPLSE